MFSSPIIVAPMAGGPSTPELVIAAARANALGFLAGGYKSAAALATQITAVRAEAVPFGVNLFVPDGRSGNPAALLAYRESLRPDADRYGIELPELRPEADDDDWPAKIALLREHPVPFVSFAFGLPAAADIRELRSYGTIVGATVTTTDEALAADEAGVDFLIVQHSNAGGHSGAFLDLDYFDRVARPKSLVELLTAVAQVTALPTIAAGGLSNSAAVSAALHNGAVAAQLGTAFLCADEAGTRAVHRSALTSGAFSTTVRTRAFSGRWARGLANRFSREHDRAPEGYPQIHHLTQPLRAAAAAAGDPDGINLWAGTGFAAVRPGSTANIVIELLS